MHQNGLLTVAALAGLANLAAARAQYFGGGYGGGAGGFGGGNPYGGGFNGGNYGGNNGGNYGGNYGATPSFAASAAAASASGGYGGGQNYGGGNYGSGGGYGNELALDPNNVQTGSQQDGQDDTAEEGQSPSLTDNANFINFCTGKTLTNGLQQTGGSCNGIVMGDIPNQGQMVSSIIVSPQPGETIPENTDFQIQVQTANLAAGSFTNPDNTYYAAPQTLDDSGAIIGHTHVTVQDMGGTFTPTDALDPTQFAFFKGINDAGNGNGLLAADVEGGLPAGTYRVCTMSSASNHQPVLMPVAQRGAQDDCTKFTVSGGGYGGYNNYSKKARRSVPAKKRQSGKFATRKFVA